nr:anticodon nuclease [Brucella anthropi]
MGQTLEEIANRLRTPQVTLKTVTKETKQIAPKEVEEQKPVPKVQLIYAFNASGKTRLSREFRELIDPKTEERDDDHRPKVLYYNAFTEDLFYWDNDLTGDTDRKLCIQPNAFTKSAFEDLGLDLNVITVFQRYTQPNLTPRFNEEYKAEDKDGKEITVPAFSEVIFTLGQDPETNPERLKISKGEESNFIWSVFYCLLDQVISTRNVAEVEERETAQFNDLEYVFIDDPVSSLDENHLIQLAVDVADLIKRSDTVNGLKFIITTHSPLFFNVLFNELQNKSCYMLKRLEDGTFELTEKNGDSNQSFSYHLHLKKTLEDAIAADKIERYHFTLLRNLYEKTSNFLGYPRWSELLPGDQQLYLNRIIQFTSHSTLSIEAIAEPSPQEKQTVKLLLDHLRNNYSYWQEEAPNA